MLGLSPGSAERMTTVHETPGRRARRAPYLALVGIGVLAGIAAVVVLATRDGGSRPAAQGSSALLTADELRARVAASGKPAYWVGPRPGARYTFELRDDGSAFIGYVAHREDGPAAHPVVATYPVRNAVSEVRAAGRRDGATVLRLPDGGIGVVTRDRPANVFVAYPGVAAQVEVFDPTAGAARAAVARGRVTPVTPASAGPAEPFAVNAGELRRLADALRPRPIYWAGWQQKARYEVTMTDGGTVYVRYLPAGVRAGDPRKGLLTVATYPRDAALADIRAAAQRDGAVSFEVPGGGLAVYDRATPENVHLAYPGQGSQIEVYGAKETDVASLVRAGKILRVP